MLFSIIIPVYNRPQELKELLQSLYSQESPPNYEVVVIEDGSSFKSRLVVSDYEDKMPIRYVEIPNGGPANARNVGAKEAQGDFFIILDSDVVLPVDYLSRVASELEQDPACDAFGGPDMADISFSSVQKAINYAMTSFLTTGGIRGGRHRLTKKYYPRSFNLGCRASVYRSLGGFERSMRFGEDIDFSMRLYEAGHRVRLYPGAGVFHKRRIDFKKFFKQVFNFGIARVHLSQRHPGTMKWVYLLPSLFTIGTLGWFIASFFIPSLWWGVGLLMLVIFIDSLRLNCSLAVALLSIPATWTQLLGYGTGYLYAAWCCYILQSREFTTKTFSTKHN